MCANRELLSDPTSYECDNLMIILNHISPIPKMIDQFVWWCESSGLLVKSVFSILNSFVSQDFQLSIDLKLSLKCV